MNTLTHTHIYTHSHLINQIDAGKDATKEFKMLHNKRILKTYGSELLLGPLVTSNHARL